MSDEIVQRSVDELIPYINNARTHSDEQVAQIAASIKEFGFLNPIITDGDSGIIAGHGRLLAAVKLGLDEVPTIEAAHLSEAQKKAYILADNKLALNAGWDESLLSVELQELQASDFDLSLTGFSGEELEALLAPSEENEGLTDDDAAPEVKEDPKTQIGDLFFLGSHKLLCGDSTQQEQVQRLLDGAESDLVFTDPPYGMSYGGGRAEGDHARDKKTGGVKIKSHGMIIGDDLKGDALLQMVADSISEARKCSKEGAATYICFTWRTYSEFHAALASIGATPKACIVWDKKSIGLGNSHYRPQHEFIFYCDGQWYGGKSQSDVWEMSRGNTGEYVHPTQKPVELIVKALENSSKRGDIVHDCFGGSGSTLIACEKTGRNARLMELDPKYCDVIIQRWQDYTGEDALREDGVRFKDLQIGEITKE